MKICTVEGCQNLLKASGLCNMHYHRRIVAEKKINPCACGCGELTSYKFKHGHHTRLFTPEEQSRRGRMNNGDAQRDRGNKDTYRKVGGRHEHRTVAAKKIGRPLTYDDVVHHIDHNKVNNHPDNLEVMTRAEHLNLHRKDWVKK